MKKSYIDMNLTPKVGDFCETRFENVAKTCKITGIETRQPFGKNVQYFRIKVLGRSSRLVPVDQFANQFSPILDGEKAKKLKNLFKVNMPLGTTIQFMDGEAQIVGYCISKRSGRFGDYYEDMTVWKITSDNGSNVNFKVNSYGYSLLNDSQVLHPQYTSLKPFPEKQVKRWMESRI